MKLLTRDQFREGVFARDNHKCVLCDKPAVDAHHILERRLFSDGGYYLNNGASVCEEHHLQCEMTLISVEDVREACGIEKKVIPDDFYDDHIYDKWGNTILTNGTRTRGELFFDESVQKILAAGKVLDLFTPYVKYPRTFHIPWSQGMNTDDRMLKDMSHFHNKEVVVTVKMDGENCVDGSTEVITNKGVMTIEDISKSNLTDLMVLSYNHKTNTNEYQNIEKCFVTDESDSDEWFEIELENGVILRATGEHEIFCEGEGYKKFKDLNGSEDLKFMN